MKYRIVEVKKRNLFARFLSINHWQVIVQDEEGYRYRVNAWAGVFGSKDPSYDSLLWSIKEKIKQGKIKKLKYLSDEHLIGVEIEVNPPLFCADKCH